MRPSECIGMRPIASSASLQRADLAWEQEQRQQGSTDMTLVQAEYLAGEWGAFVLLYDVAHGTKGRWTERRIALWQETKDERRPVVQMYSGILTHFDGDAITAQA